MAARPFQQTCSKANARSKTGQSRKLWPVFIHGGKLAQPSGSLGPTILRYWMTRTLLKARLPSSRSERYGAVIPMRVATCRKLRPASSRSLRIAAPYSRGSRTCPVPLHRGQFISVSLCHYSVLPPCLDMARAIKVAHKSNQRARIFAAKCFEAVCFINQHHIFSIGWLFRR